MAVSEGGGTLWEIVLGRSAQEHLPGGKRGLRYNGVRYNEGGLYK